MTSEQAERWIEKPLLALWSLLPAVAYEPVARAWRWWQVLPVRLEVRQAVVNGLIPTQRRLAPCGRCGEMVDTIFSASLVDGETGRTWPIRVGHRCESVEEAILAMQSRKMAWSEPRGRRRICR